MPTGRRRRFIHGQLASISIVLVGLAALDELTLELFFVCSLIAFLTVVLLTAPVNVTPSWRRRLKWFVGAGLVVFTVLAIRRILEILPPELIDGIGPDGLVSPGGELLRLFAGGG